MSDPKPFDWNTEAKPFDWDKEAAPAPQKAPVPAPVEEEEPGFFENIKDEALYHAGLSPLVGTRTPKSHQGLQKTTSPMDATRSLLQNMTYGYADELSAGAEAPITAIRDGIGLKDAYRKGVAKYRPMHEEAVKNAPEMAIPAAMLTWELGGGSGAKKVAEGAEKVVENGSRLAKAGKGFLKNAALGGLAGYGTAGDDNAAGQTLGGAAFSAGADLLFRGGASTLSKQGVVNRYLREKAEAMALKAMGASGGISNAMRQMGFKTADEARQLGRAALDLDLIPFAGSKDAVLKRADGLADMSGSVVGDVMDKANKSGVPYDYAQAEAAARAKLAGNSSVADRVSGPANDFIDDINAQAQKTPGNWEEARKLKTDAQGGVNWSDKAKLGRETHRDAVQGYTENFQKQVGDVLGPDELETLRAANHMYGVSRDVGELAAEASTREAQNRSYGLVGTMMGVGTGLAVGGKEGAAAGLLVPLIESTLKKRGPAAGAVAADTAQKLLSSKYAQSIANASAKGAPSLAALWYVLKSRDPEFRALTEDDAR